MPKTSFSDTENDVFVILASKFKGFVFSFVRLFILVMFQWCLKFKASENGFFPTQNHTGTPKTSFSDAQNDVFSLLPSKFEAFVSVFSGFSILERVCRVFEAS